MTTKQAATVVFSKADLAHVAVLAARNAGAGHALPTEWAEKLNDAATILNDVLAAITKSDEFNEPE